MTISASSWQEAAQQYAWQQALHLANQHSVSETLTALSHFQKNLRAKQWSSAERHLGMYTASLDALDTQEQAFFQEIAAPDTLKSALQAIQSAERITDLETLQTHLAVADHPMTRAEQQNILGIFHALSGNRAQAQLAFEAAIAADHLYHRARINLGNLHLEAGELAEAESCYRAIIQEAPDVEGAHYNLGVVLRKQGKFGESVKSIRRANQLGRQQSRAATKEDLQEKMHQFPWLRPLIYIILAVIVICIIRSIWF